MKKVFFAFICLFLVIPCRAEVITVRSDGSGNCTTIQAAIDAAVDGDTVIVALDTYTGRGNRDINFGGKAITVQGTDPNDPDMVAATIIDCEGSSRRPHRGFCFQNNEDANSVIAGFTIINGYTDSGGGIYCEDSSPTITKCAITGNLADYNGGGISCHHSDAIINNCTITSNSANWSGGGIYCEDSSPAITNCTITGNSANDYGGGTLCQDANPMIVNCIFWDNLPEQIAAPFGDSTVSVTYSDVQGGWSGTGNMNADPLFVNAANGDYHLLEYSPCVNAGDPDYVAKPNETDLDGLPRVTGGQIDMGAYEFTGNNAIPIANAGPDQTVYAWLDGTAEVTLDGTASFDGDGHPLTYLWTWTVADEIYTATGPNAVIALPVGDYIVTLTVNDGIEDSEPNEVGIKVIEPAEAQLRISLRIIRRYSRMKTVSALVRLPEGVTKDQIDGNEPLLLYPQGDPNGIEAMRQFVFQYRQQGALRTAVFVFFDKAELMEAVPGNGEVELEVVGMFKTGRYFYGSDTVWIKG